MKRLIALIFLAPAFASAVCPPLPPRVPVCEATRGTADVSFDFPFNFAGSGFSASGELTQYGNFLSPFQFSQVEIGQSYDAPIYGDIGSNALFGLLTQFKLTVNGVPWGIPTNGGYASVDFSEAILSVDGLAQDTSDFRFDGTFTGAPEPFAPGLGCDVLNCKTLNFSGHGIVTFGLVPEGSGEFFMVLVGETFKFVGAPEPSTASLLLLGFAGLAVMGSRRKSRVRLLPAG